MKGLDDYYGDDRDAFPDAEELAERVEHLEAENERLRGQIQAVRELHHLHGERCQTCAEDANRHTTCETCRQVWPCDTLAVINGIGDA